MTKTVQRTDSHFRWGAVFAFAVLCALVALLCLLYWRWGVDARTVLRLGYFLAGTYLLGCLCVYVALKEDRLRERLYGKWPFYKSPLGENRKADIAFSTDRVFDDIDMDDTFHRAFRAMGFVMTSAGAAAAVFANFVLAALLVILGVVILLLFRKNKPGPAKPGSKKKGIATPLSCGTRMACGTATNGIRKARGMTMQGQETLAQVKATSSVGPSIFL